MGFAHLVQHHRRAVLGSDLQLTADMVHYQLLHELVVLVLDEVVVTYSRADKDLFHALDLAYLTQHGKVFAVVNFKCGTGGGSKALLAHAKSLGELLVAGGTAEVRRGTAYIVYVALEIGHFCYALRFLQHRLLAPDGDTPALMEGDGAEVAVAEAAAVVGD